MTGRAGLALLVCAGVLTGCGQADRPSALRSGSAELAKLRRVDPDASRLLPGGLTEFRRRVRAARGRPLVVNQWASWCGPCRFEFPSFQRQALRLRGRVAFLGVDSKDSSGAARAFLARFPTPYPHLADPDAAIARSFGGGRGWPTTAFFDARGRVTFVHTGAYPDEGALRRDIRRYARGG